MQGVYTHWLGNWGTTRRSLHSQNEPRDLCVDGQSEAMCVLEQGIDMSKVQMEWGKGQRDWFGSYAEWRPEVLGSLKQRAGGENGKTHLSNIPEIKSLRFINWVDRGGEVVEPREPKSQAQKILNMAVLYPDHLFQAWNIPCFTQNMPWIPPASSTTDAHQVEPQNLGALQPYVAVSLYP